MRNAHAAAKALRPPARWVRRHRPPQTSRYENPHSGESRTHAGTPHPASDHLRCRRTPRADSSEAPPPRERTAPALGPPPISPAPAISLRYSLKPPETATSWIPHTAINSHSPTPAPLKTSASTYPESHDPTTATNSNPLPPSSPANNSSPTRTACTPTPSPAASSALPPAFVPPRLSHFDRPPQSRGSSALTAHRARTESPPRARPRYTHTARPRRLVAGECPYTAPTAPRRSSSVSRPRPHPRPLRHCRT